MANRQRLEKWQRRNPLRTVVVIVAAGQGSRFGGEVPKQWISLKGRSLVERSIGQFRAAMPEAELVLVIAKGERDRAAHLEDVRVIEGGADRVASVRAGLEALADEGIDRVLIHDAARPLVPVEVIRAVGEALNVAEGAAPGLAVTDALWQAENGHVTGAADRSGLWRAQTPQGFRFAAILAAHRGFKGEAADDVAIARDAGMSVLIVPGDERNMKITHPQDLTRAEALLEVSMQIRTGSGYDVHKFCKGDHVWLCGVKIEHNAGLEGHSDADVGLHAACDAIYGALAMGDIGRHFPPSDKQWKGAASSVFLEHAGKLATESGYRIGNIDVTIVCEKPKIGPHAEAMQARMAEILGLDSGQVSVKATTSEGLGFTGRKEGIAAMALATLIGA
jgi:2-C-methyl-D-erythritol 4-phosphate cytidylyltransferase/2-C-methyl-D-erythritol 2,4-cyclodiphosphate synthase